MEKGKLERLSTAWLEEMQEQEDSWKEKILVSAPGSLEFLTAQHKIAEWTATRELAVFTANRVLQTECSIPAVRFTMEERKKCSLGHIGCNVQTL